jgi:serine/threonine protein kinase
MSMRDVSAKQDKMTLGIEREIVIMKLIEHPNLLGLIDVYETSKELFLILEYVAGGELFDYLVSKGRLRPSEARSYFRQIIFGLHYCHSFNICHRDLKPENLLLDGTRKVVKVADFGMAALQPSEKMLETSCGSPHYASPEIVSGKSYKGTASDIWSCGIILFALLCGRLPFDDPNIQTLLGKVRLGKFDMPEYLEPLAKDLIWRMLVVDPERRLTMREIMRHPWFTDNGAQTSRNPVETNLEKLAEEQLDIESLDMDILNNLKTLWPEYSQADIVEQLTTKGPNWQKTFYTLLVQHRENYSGDEEDDEEESKLIGMSPQVPVSHKENSLGLSLGINAPSQLAASSKEKARPRRSFEGNLDEQAAVIAPPASPRKPLIRANTDQTSASPGRQLPFSPLRTPRSPAGPRESAQTSPTRPSPNRAYSLDAPQTYHHATPPISKVRPLPTPAVSSVKAVASPAKGLGSIQHAQQTVKTSIPLVQVAPAPIVAPLTPKSNRLRSSSIADDATPKAVEVSSTTQSRPPSRAGSIKTTTSRRPNSIYGEAKGAPTVGVPQIGDASMQQFFREIADELASIRVQGGRPDSLQLKLDQLEKVAASIQAMGAKKAKEDDGMAQFDDAEDDVDDDQYSVRSGATSEASSHPYTPTSPLAPSLASPPLKTQPLALIDRDAQSYNRTAVKGTPSIISTTSQSTTSSSGPTSVLGRKGSFLLGRKRSERKVTTSSEASSKSSAYERLQEAGASAAPRPPTKLQQKNPGLGLDIGLSAGAISPSPALKSPALKSPGLKSPALTGHSAAAPMKPGLVSPALNTSPKQSWFAGLFNWKPATASLMSTENFSTTHMETKRLLLHSGARVFVEDSENAGVLKCSLNEGNVGSSKPVRFRVEFQILPKSSTASPAIGGTPRSILASPLLSSHSPSVQQQQQQYATSITLIQEKGSLASFKQVYNSLKRSWTLDIPGGSVPNSPAATPGYNIGLGVSGVGSRIR